MTLCCAIIAPGAMGSAIARRVAEHGGRVLTSLEGRSGATADRARGAGMRAASDEEIAAEADLFLSVVPPATALGLAERFERAFAAQGRRPAFVDLNAISPDTATHVGRAFAPDQVFVDGCIIGAPPSAESSPVLYLSGDAAAAAAELCRVGLDARALPGPVGQASALKMCYGGITKGLAALGAAVAVAADRHGVTDILTREVQASLPDIAKRLHATLPQVSAKAYRWVAEMQEVGGFVGPDGGGVFQQIATFYDAFGQQDDATKAVVAEFLATAPAKA